MILIVHVEFVIKAISGGNHTHKINTHTQKDKTNLERLYRILIFMLLSGAGLMEIESNNLSPGRVLRPPRAVPITL